MAPKVKVAPPPDPQVEALNTSAYRRRVFAMAPPDEKGAMWEHEADTETKAAMEADLRALAPLQRNALPYHVRAALGLLKGAPA